MSRWTLFPLLAAGFVVPIGLSAQGVDAVLGKWRMTMETPRGSISQQFEFQLDGDVLTGTVKSRRGSSDLTNVKFEDGTLAFDVERSFGARSFVQHFTAKIEDGVMQGAMSGGRGGDREFTATRVETGPAGWPVSDPNE